MWIKLNLTRLWRWNKSLFHFFARCWLAGGFLAVIEFVDSMLSHLLHTPPPWSYNAAMLAMQHTKVRRTQQQRHVSKWKRKETKIKRVKQASLLECLARFSYLRFSVYAETKSLHLTPYKNAASSSVVVARCLSFLFAVNISPIQRVARRV